MHFSRPVVTAIAIPAAVVASVGAFLLVGAPSGHAGARTRSPAPSARPSIRVTASPSPSPSPTKRHHRRKPRRKRPGASSPGNAPFVGVAINGYVSASVSSFASTTGVHPAMVEIYINFGSAFPSPQAGQIRASGAMPFIQWDPSHAPLSQIAAGDYDGYIRQFATAVKAFGHPVMLSFAHEMNGTWYPWGRSHATPAQFIAAWRRIHTLFSRQGVTNVTWSWDPSHTGGPASQWWPGPAYVNWIGIDGYLRPGQTFAEIFAQQLANIRSVTQQPIFIAETAVAPSAGQARQITEIFDGVRSYGLLGFVYFDVNALEPWRLQGRPSAIRAFRRDAARMGI